MQNSKLQFKIQNLDKIKIHSKTFNFELLTLNSNSGQALLIIVLVMVIALTIGLSIASKSIFDLRMSKEEQESKKAFQAAEAGIEQALKMSSTGIIIADQNLDTEESVKIKSVNVSAIDGSTFLLNGGNPVTQDDGIDVWLSDYPDYASPLSGVTNFGIAWGYPTNDCSGQKPAAIEAVVVYGPITNPTSKRYTFDPCSRGNNFSNDIEVPSLPIQGKNFPYITKISGLGSIDINNGLILRVVPVYASTLLAVFACSSDMGTCFSLPSQGKVIESIGQSGEAQRKITVYEGYRKLPAEFFQYVLFKPQ